MTDEDYDGVDTERSREAKLKALVRKDLNPTVTAIAKETLRRRQNARDDE